MALSSGRSRSRTSGRHGCLPRVHSPQTSTEWTPEGSHEGLPAHGPDTSWENMKRDIEAHGHGHGHGNGRTRTGSGSACGQLASGDFLSCSGSRPRRRGAWCEALVQAASPFSGIFILISGVPNSVAIRFVLGADGLEDGSCLSGLKHRQPVCPEEGEVSSGPAVGCWGPSHRGRGVWGDRVLARSRRE